MRIIGPLRGVASWIRKTGPLVLLPYHSFGAAPTAVIRGRVLANPAIRPAVKDEHALRAIVRTIERFLTREVAGVTVLCELGDWKGSATTDSNGYFALPVPVHADRSEWVNAHLAIEGHHSGSWSARVLVLAADTSRLVISDVDDTLLVNGTGDLIRTVAYTVRGTVFTRKPVEGTPALYRKLSKATLRAPEAPVFYVSSSPWNLHDFLIRFLDHHGFPEGPLSLRDFGLNSRTVSSSAHGGHKVTQISNVLGLAPSAKVILLGDSSQQDAAAFAEIISEWPGRVVAAFIRDVGDPRKAEAVTEIAAGLDVPMELINSAETIERRAAELGWFR